MASLVVFSKKKLSRIVKHIQPNGSSGNFRFFKLKVCLTFDDLTFADITPVRVGSGVREIEN